MPDMTSVKIKKVTVWTGIAVLLIFLLPLILYQRFTTQLPLPPQAEQRRAVLLPDQLSVTYELLVDGLVNPWGMAFLPDGRILVTEKHGEIRIIENEKLLAATIAGVPEVAELGQGGLLDIELHPEFRENNWLYLTYAHAGDSGSNTSVMRATLRGSELTEHRVLYRGTPDTEREQHFGSRIVFDNDGYLYFSIGDRGDREANPQDISRDGGKIYRLKDDGTVPASNPFIGLPRAIPAIYSFGHRNPQGLALQPETGLIWEHEHGPQGGDEINIIRSGANYGWPEITYGVNYGGVPITSATSREGMEQPVQFWTPSIAPCGMTFIVGTRYPGWQGDLLVGSLKFGHLVRVDVEGEEIVKQEVVAAGIGRVRNVKESPAGVIYVAIEGTGLYRLIPG